MPASPNGYLNLKASCSYSYALKHLLSTANVLAQIHLAHRWLLLCSDSVGLSRPQEQRRLCIYVDCRF